MPGFYEPLIPQTAVSPLQEALERRRLDQSPLEAQLKGFGSGALEGLRSLSSPAQLLGLAGLAVPAVRAAGVAPRVMQGLQRAMPAMDVLESGPVAQVAPAADDVASLIGQLKYNLARVPKVGSPTPAALDPRITGLVPKTVTQRPTFQNTPFMDEMFSKYIGKMR